MIKEKDKKRIIFAYERSKIFNIVSLNSNYKSRMLQDKEGNYIGEPYALSADERDAFNLCVENVAAIISEELLKLTDGIDNAFYADSDKVQFEIVDLDTYNPNSLLACDIAIKDVLVNGILFNWYQIVSHEEFTAEYEKKFSASLNILHERAFQLRKYL